MQLPVDFGISLRKYAKKGINQDFPKPESCFDCKSKKLHKHGFYWRNCLDGIRAWYIPIRRYRCLHCKKTMSLLPDFCLAGFQYAKVLILKIVSAWLLAELPLERVRKNLAVKYPQLASWSVSHINFYAGLCLRDLPRIELVLRQIDPSLELADRKMGTKKRAKKALAQIHHRFVSLDSFCETLQRICQSSFLTPLRKLFYHTNPDWAS